MIQLTFLHGYAGLRLKNNKPIEFKKGINLIIGKNGSGKSNLAVLLKYIFNSNNLSNKKLFESTLIEQLIKDAIKKYEERRTKNEQILEEVIPADFNNHNGTFCKFLFEGAEGSIYFKLDHGRLVTDFPRYMKDARFTSEYVSINPSRNLFNSDIEAKIQLNNSDIVINQGYNLFGSNEQTNPIVNSIVNSFNSFFQSRLKQFREADSILLEEINKLQVSVIEQYNNFFEQTSKKIIITLDPVKYNGKALVLTEGENIIEFESLSDGEKNLFNLIINLATARENKPVLIYFDEPELFMHEDMIRTLVKEIHSLSGDLTDTCIMVSTHSSVLIEALTELEKGKLNLITITDKQISNSNEDVEFINVLHNNGVKFSPLYLSKRPNLFIENIGETGKLHQEFYSRFFHKSKSPNIIPIGSSGQVKTYQNYTSIIQQIVKTQPGSNTSGILDGDMFIVKPLQSFFNDENDLSTLINDLKANKSFYIYPSNYSTIKTCYFNCWEIENLYILNEIIPYWKLKSDPTQRLEFGEFVNIVKNIKSRIIKSWLKTYKRSIVPALYFDNETSEKLRENFEKMIDPLKKAESINDEMHQKMEAFFDALIKEELLQWLPGKEVIGELKSRYTLDQESIPFDFLSITGKIRSIIEV